MGHQYHLTVMKAEVVEYLDVSRGGLFVDGTLGGGGHSEAILEAAEAAGADVQLIAVDLDQDALDHAAARLGRFENVRFLQANYGDLPEILAQEGLRADGLVIDAGVSSHQLDAAHRGFSFSKDAPLDMRMGAEGPTAAELLASLDEGSIAQILARYGEVRGARRLARAIVAAARAGELETTSQLAALCPRPRPGQRIHPATQVFQAVRIAVNDELASLQRLVEALPDVLEMGGRCAFISFHSLEDRIVKHGLRDHARGCVCPPGLPQCVCDNQPKMKSLGKVVTPSPEEIDRNPRARSAKLRAATRVG